MIMIWAGKKVIQNPDVSEVLGPNMPCMRVDIKFRDNSADVFIGVNPDLNYEIPGGGQIDPSPGIPFSGLQNYSVHTDNLQNVWVKGAAGDGLDYVVYANERWPDVSS